MSVLKLYDVLWVSQRPLYYKGFVGFLSFLLVSSENAHMLQTKIDLRWTVEQQQQNVTFWNQQRETEQGSNSFLSLFTTKCETRSAFEESLLESVCGRPCLFRSLLSVTAGFSPIANTLYRRLHMKQTELFSIIDYFLQYLTQDVKKPFKHLTRVDKHIPALVSWNANSPAPVFEHASMLKRTGPDTHLHPPQQAVRAWKATQTDTFMSSHRHTQISLTTGGDDSGMLSCREQTTISLSHTPNGDEISTWQYGSRITTCLSSL